MKVNKILLLTFQYQLCYHYTTHFYSRYCSNVFMTYRLFTNERNSISYSKIYTHTHSFITYDAGILCPHQYNYELHSWHPFSIHQFIKGLIYHFADLFIFQSSNCNSSSNNISYTFQNTLGNPTAIINHKRFKYTGQSGFQYFTSVVLLTAFAEAHVNITI